MIYDSLIMRYMIEPKTDGYNDGYTKFLEVKSFQNQLSLGKVLKQIIFLSVSFWKRELS